MRTGRFALAVAVAASLVVVSTAGGMRADKTFTDATGDAPANAPDITTVVVSNAGDRITWRVNVANQAQLAQDSDVLLLIDTDRNPNTGDPGALGADYLFEVDVSGYTFAKWTGSDWDTSIPYSTVNVYYDHGAIFSVNRNQIGGTRAFSFWTRGVRHVDANTLANDDAPDDGVWSYVVSSFTIGRIAAAHPSEARAGRPFAVTVSYVTLIPGGKRVKPSSVSCAASVGSRLIGSGPCRWVIPKSARGRTLNVQVTASYGAASKTIAFAVGIR